jgi:hypothetical protein
MPAIMLARFLLAIASLTIVVDGYWRMQCSLIETGRIDPIVSPGKISGHAHKIAGGSSQWPYPTSPFEGDPHHYRSNN